MPSPIPPQAPFSILESYVHGGRFLIRHIRLIGVLSFLPLAVSMATMLGMRLGEDHLKLFWLPIVQLPSNFVIGLQCALLLRFLVLHEYPIIEDGENRASRNRAVSQSAFVYTIIMYLTTGAFMGFDRFSVFMLNDREAAAPYAPLMLAGIVVFVWSVRWFWLNVPVALDWPVRGFYDRVGKWAGSLRIFGLFILCALSVNVVAGFLRSMIAALGGKNPAGIFTALDDAVVAFATVMLAVLFTCASAAAVKLMAGIKFKDIDA